MNSRRQSQKTQEPLNSPNVVSELQLQINDLNQRLTQSQATIGDLKKDLQPFEKQQKSLNRWFSKIPFVIILLSFIAVGIASYIYPWQSGINWIWHGDPDVVKDHFEQENPVEVPHMILTLALWVAYGVLWQIFVLVNVTDLVKYLHIYSSARFRFLARLTLIATFVGGIYMLLMCLRASNLIENVMSSHYPIKWLFTSILMVVPLVGALMLSGGLPTHLKD